MKPKFVCPLIAVSDMERSKKFYIKLLGQEIENDFGENVGFKGGLSLHEVNHFHGLIEKEYQEEGSLGKDNMELYFEEDQVEEMSDKLKAAEVEFLHELKTQPWQQRCMRFYDPDKYIIEVGESMEAVVRRLSGEGLSPEKINEACMMPLEFIEAVLGEK